MPPLMAAMATPVLGSITAGTMLSTGFSLLSAFSGMQESSAQAKAIQQQGNYEASVQEQAAGQERASAQRSALEQRRQGRLSQSRARTVAAASGGGVSDPTVVNIIGDIGGESEYRALTALHAGEENALGREQQAGLSRYSSGIEAAGTKRKGRSNFVTALGSAGFSLMDKYAPSSSATGGAYGGGWTTPSSGRIDWAPAGQRVPRGVS